MNNNLHVTKKVVRSDRQPTTEEREADVAYEAGDLSKPHMVNQAIEDHRYRLTIPEGEGNICISVEPGEELGQIAFNVQFEGTAGAYEFCMARQNELLLYVSEWLKDLLGKMGADFDVKVEGNPCPKTNSRIEISRAAAILSGQLSLEAALSLRDSTARDVRTSHDREITRSNRY